MKLLTCASLRLYFSFLLFFLTARECPNFACFSRLTAGCLACSEGDNREYIGIFADVCMCV